MRLSPRGGFTLVELLVVVTITSIMILMLLPAVQAVREAARQAQCANNLKQLGLGATHHAETHSFLPTGGWGWGWIGDPDRGFDTDQPGGWGYNVLPFIEQEGLHNLGAGQADAQKKAALAIVAATPLAVFNCPTRRRPLVYPYVHSSPYYSIDPPKGAGRSDYAACAGIDNPGDEKGPGSVAAAASYGWQHDRHNGVCYQRSMVTFGHITDGASNTYLIGERYINPDGYFSGKEQDDDQCLYVGHDLDVLRWGSVAPLRDRPAVTSGLGFGSAHADIFQVVFCDGSVHTLNYSIDPNTHAALACRNDGVRIDPSKY